MSLKLPSLSDDPEIPPSDPAWRTLGSQTVIANRWVNLRADDCVTASGKPVSPYYVLSYPPWVHVVALTDADEVILVRQYRYAAGAMVIELPGGQMDAADSSTEQAARRELLEETGYEAGGLMHAVCPLYANPATHTNQLHAFATAGARRIGPPRLEPSEDSLSVLLVPVADLLPKLPCGFIGHAMQVSALLLGLMALGRIDLSPARVPRPGA